VLVVDDVASERELICNYLRESGYEVASAIDGSDGLQKFDAMQPQVVVTDLVMPGMSGLELCRAIKKKSGVPVVACTSKDSQLDRLWGVRQGIDAYLTKPFSRDDLVRALQLLLMGTVR